MADGRLGDICGVLSVSLMKNGDFKTTRVSLKLFDGTGSKRVAGGDENFFVVLQKPSADL